MVRIATWSGVHGSDVDRVDRPETEEELASLVADAARRGLKVKVVGALHSFSDIAMTPGRCVSLDRMDRLSSVDHERARVTVGGGMRLHKLNATLANNGLAMPILGSVAEQSIAGAAATGTHGSSLVHKNLASFIVGMRLVTGRGELLELAEADPRLPAARVGLGALGIVTQVTLQVGRAFRLIERSRSVDFDDALARMSELAREAEYVKLWWLPHTDQVEVYSYERTTRPETFLRAARQFDERVINRHVFSRLLAVSARLPGAIPLVNRAVKGAYLKDAEVVGASHCMFGLPMPPVHRETEFAVSVEHAAAAFDGLRRLVADRGLRVNFIQELRFVRGDGSWMSPAFGRDTCQLGAYMAESRDLASFFSGFEALMTSFGGRPHWGKEFSATAGYLASVYPRYEAFRALRAELDPDATFGNAFLTRVLG